MRVVTVTIDAAAAEAVWGRLTPHQQRLVDLSLLGYTEIEVAGRMGITWTSVGNHKRQIRSRFGGCSWLDVLRVRQAMVETTTTS